MSRSNVIRSNHFYGLLLLLVYGNQNLLTIRKIHFMHWQQYDENRRVYLARLGRHSEKAGGNVTTHAQH